MSERKFQIFREEFPAIFHFDGHYYQEFYAIDTNETRWYAIHPETAERRLSTRVIKDAQIHSISLDAEPGPYGGKIEVTDERVGFDGSVEVPGTLRPEVELEQLRRLGPKFSTSQARRMRDLERFLDNSETWYHICDNVGRKVGLHDRIRTCFECGFTKPEGR